MNKTKIDWCDSTWNPVSGCRHNCEYCYARNIAKRFGGYTYAMEDLHDDVYAKDDGVIRELDRPLYVMRGSTFEETKYQKAPYPYDFIPTLHRYRLNDYVTKKGRNIFVCSMADLFGDWVPDSWLDGVFEACRKAPQHNYLFLTKNVKRYCKNEGGYGVPVADNMWYGTSITKSEDVSRFNSLPAFCNTFVSIEPLLEDIKPERCNIMFRQVDWVIIGAETGCRKDRVVPERRWIEDIVKECRKNEKPVFMKSSLAPIWGGPLIQEFPDGLKRQEGF